MICYQYEAGRRQRKREKWEETTNGKVINKKSENEMMTQEKYESNGTKNQKQRKKKNS